MKTSCRIGEWIKSQRLKKQWTTDVVVQYLDFETVENLNLYEEGIKPIKCRTFYWLVHLYQIDSDELFTFMQEIGVWRHR